MKLESILEAYRYGQVTSRILGRLSNIGIDIQFYFLVKEGGYTGNPKWETQYSDYQVSLLNFDDMPEMASTHLFASLENLKKRLENKHLCVGIKYKDQLVGYTWSDTKYFNNEPCFPFALKDNEAYLYDAFTLPDFRGKGLAPFMRYKCYEVLKTTGRDTFYSISDCFNNASIHFKKKINAEFVKLFFYINLGKGKVTHNWLLKKLN